ncbi:dethiobiotin synthase [Arcobacter sp. FWKO B]|uniref:dethiobiotin synthase n=1 Tax=Arcobacter sp. FWKO B TaxID=2593672 RepID=UPI0018A41303|nr:dethiobiotin synthase [Arcobacter sp. FWKO B]QOG12932.1 dethiobiotin synthase [Arcobacter sp. FWKO B]
MKQTFFVTATNTNVGKTYTCEKLLIKYANMGYKVGYYKPIETGVINNNPLDGSSMLRLAKSLNSDFTVDINDVVPYRFDLPAAPYVASKGLEIDVNFLIKQKEYLEQFCDVLIIEGAGGLMVPIRKDFFIIDLIKKFECDAILVSPSNLGCINDTLLSHKVLSDYGIKYEWYINLYNDKESFYDISYPFLKDYFGEVRFVESI